MFDELKIKMHFESFLLYLVTESVCVMEADLLLSLMRIKIGVLFTNIRVVRMWYSG